jgi:hypothetical protein
MYAKIVAGLLTAVFLGTGIGWARDFAAPPAGYFSLQWEAQQAKNGQPAVRGHITNNYTLWADNVRLRLEALDSAGQVIAGTIGYVDECVPPNGRGYFYVPAPARGASYRVAVQSWSWRTSPRSNAPFFDRCW